MQIIANLQLQSGLISENPNDIVGAFVGEQCRGVASPFSGGLIFLSVGSDLASGELITFKAYISGNDMEVELNESIVFQNQQLIGNPGDPFIFTYTSTNPELLVNPSTISFGGVNVGSCQTSSYQLSGSNLSADVIVNAPEAFQVSLVESGSFQNSLTIIPSNGNIQETVYVKFCPDDQQQYSDFISNTSTGATMQTVSVSGTGIDDCSPGWVPAPNLQYNMQVIGQIVIDGEISLNEIDVIGAFVNGQCRGIASPDASFNGLLFLTIGSNIPSGETIEFMIWNADQCEDCPVEATIVFENQQLIGNPAEPYFFSCSDALSHVISLNTGWSGISSYFAPENTDIQYLSGQIDGFQFINNLSVFYQPGNPGNNLLNWDYSSGYFVKTTAATQFIIQGLPPINKTIYLPTGWSLIPVLSNQPVNISLLFSGQTNKIEIIKEAIGLQVFWPVHGIYSLQQLYPGKAYFIKLNQPATITFD